MPAPWRICFLPTLKACKANAAVDGRSRQKKTIAVKGADRCDINDGNHNRRLRQRGLGACKSGTVVMCTGLNLSTENPIGEGIVGKKGTDSKDDRTDENTGTEMT